jgi:hypothetical protein
MFRFIYFLDMIDLETNSKYKSALGAYGMTDNNLTSNNLNYSADSRVNNPTYRERFIGALKRPDKALWRHKGKVATAVAEGGLIKYLSDLKGVASNALVESGLKIGKVITYPVRPEIFWPHIVDTKGQIPMNPTYADNPLVSGLLNASKDPLFLGAVLIVPPALYAVYRTIEHFRNKANK